MMPDRLLLIDGHSLVFRAFHALPALTAPSGELTNATYGFTSMLVSAYRDLRPRYVVAAFDTSARTFRDDRYQEYKATRGPAPEGLSHQFQRVRQVLDAFHVPVFELDGFEADDVIGTLAEQARQQGLEVIILSGDMDGTQLVNDRVRLLVPVQGITRTRLYDVEAVRERYGLEPSQIADFKALRGDSSDNIPGVPGVGDKTAAKLLAEHGSVEELFSHLDALPAKQRQLLEPYADQVRLARELATIVCDVPVKLDLSPDGQASPDRNKLLALFHEMGFRNLMARVDDLVVANGDREPVASVLRQAQDERGRVASGESRVADVPDQRSVRQAQLFGPQPEAPRPPVQTASAPKSDRGPDHSPLAARHSPLVSDLAGLEKLVQRLRAAGRVVFHLVVSEGSPMRVDLVGLALGAPPRNGSSEAAVAPVYVPVGHSAPPNLDWDRVRPLLQPLLEDPALPKAAHGAKEQMAVLARHGVQLRGLAFDTAIAAYLLHSGQKAGELRDLAWSRLQVEVPPLSAVLAAAGSGRGKKALPVGEVEPQHLAAHSTHAADQVGRLEPLLAAELEDNQLASLFQQVELPLLPVLAQMERTGVRVDVDYLQQLSRRLYEQLQALEAEIYRHVGHEFNINSTQKLSTVLFQELKLPAGRKTRTGHVSTGAEVLEELRGLHPIIDLLLEHRQLQKLKSTYVDALPLLVHPETGRVHTSFNQTVAATGRLSSSDPNLQNIPIRTELGREVRRAFVAGSPGEVLLSADYSQIELRILAHVTQDPTLLETFERGDDVHAATAAEVLDVPIEQVTADQRRLAKVVNFGVLYGMSGYGLASRTELPQEEAVGFIDRYFQRFATVKQYQEGVVREAEHLGYATTLLGRRRYIPELRSPIRAVREAGIRQAINLPIQGTAADIVKIAMLRIDHAIREQGLPAHMLLQVHDELVFELPESEVDRFISVLCPIMEHAMDLAAPLGVEVKVGPNWGEMKVVLSG